MKEILFNCVSYVFSGLDGVKPIQECGSRNVQCFRGLRLRLLKQWRLPGD